jgi:phthalate 4,5-cis-dihydrodiol dehydrogenase
MPPKMRLGIAGLGVASTNCLPEIIAHPNVTLTAAADVRPEARERFARDFHAETFDSVEALCASPNVDAITVLTPNRFHAEHAILAADHGKQVLCDKPMAVSLEDADRMIAAAERNGVRLLIGHTQSLDPPIRKMAEIVASGELGRPLLINTSFYSDWLYRPRSPEELDPSQGEGLVLRQGPVQVDIVRMLGGGIGKGVRASVSMADARRPIDGGYGAFLSFASQACGQLTYSAYAFSDSAELTSGIGLSGMPANLDANRASRQQIATFTDLAEEAAYKDSTRYGGSRMHMADPQAVPPDKRHAFFGFTIVTCERGEMRQSPTGLLLYDTAGRHELEVGGGDYFRRYTSVELDLMYSAWANDAPLASHDGRWGKATLEVCLGILRSSEEGREIDLACQVPYSVQL